MKELSFIDILSMAGDVLNHKYVRMTLRLLGTELTTTVTSDLGISHKMTIAKDIQPLYRRILSVYRKEYRDIYSYDNSQVIRTLVMYAILNARFKQSDWHIYKNRYAYNSYEISDGHILATMGNKYEYKDEICSSSQFTMRFLLDMHEPRGLPRYVYAPGSDIDTKLIYYYHTLGSTSRSLSYDRIMVIEYKTIRVADMMFTDIPLCSKSRKENRFDFKRDIDFIFQ